MRDMQRNKRPLWYANYTGKEPILNEAGINTLETLAQFTEPAKRWINYAGERGQTNYSVFGSFTDYTHVVATAVPIPGLDENSILWMPLGPPGESYGPDDGPYNFRVRRCAYTVNGARYAIKAVPAGALQVGSQAEPGVGAKDNTVVKGLSDSITPPRRGN